MTKKFRTVAGRSLATFAVSALSVIGAGSLVGLKVWQSALVAGIVGLARALEQLGWAYLKDGDLTFAEIDEVFSSPSKTRARTK